MQNALIAMVQFNGKREPMVIEYIDPITSGATYSYGAAMYTEAKIPPRYPMPCVDLTWHVAPRGVVIVKPIGNDGYKLIHEYPDTAQ